MSFEQYEESRAFGMPINLYYFRYGTGVTAFLAYTNTDRVVSYLGVDYQPIAIENGDIVTSLTFDNSTLDVTAARDSGISVALAAFAPSTPVQLQIRQGHLNDPGQEFPIVWVGRVLGRTIKGSQCVLSCEPLTTSLKRIGPRRFWMRQCQLALYGPQCNASFGAASAVHTPDSFTETSITMPVGWESDARSAKYLGGVVKWAGGAGDEIRTIVSVESFHILHLNGPTTGLSGGEPVTAALGCSHILELVDGALVGDCKDLHANINNFGGDPWIPLDNPVGNTKSQFY